MLDPDPGKPIHALDSSLAPATDDKTDPVAPELKQEPDPEMMWLVRLASAGALLLGGAVVWQAVVPLILDFSLSPFMHDFFHSFYSIDSPIDCLLIPLVIIYSIAAIRGLAAPDRMNLQFLSISYFTYIGRGAAKVITYYCSEETGRMDEGIYVFALFLVISVGCKGHAGVMHYLLNNPQVSLTDRQRESLCRPISDLFLGFGYFIDHSDTYLFRDAKAHCKVNSILFRTTLVIPPLFS